MGVDIEAIGLKPYDGTIWIISIHRNWGKKSELFHNCNGISSLPKQIIKELEDESIMKIIHNGSGYDMTYIELCLGIRIKNVWDSMVNETVIQGVQIQIKKKNIEEGSYEEQLLKLHSPALEYTLPRYGFKSPDKSVRDNFIDRPLGLKFTKSELNYAVGDTRDLIKLQEKQEKILIKENLIDVAKLENKVSEKIAAMRSIGLGINQPLWREIAEENIAEYNRRIKKLPEELRNPNKNKVVKEYLKEHEGIELASYEDLDTTYLETKNKNIGAFIFAKELNKSITTYGLNWFESGFIDADSRVRAGVRQSINTGRMAILDPPLQQLPGEGKSDVIHLAVMEKLYKGAERKKPRHREAFQPAKGKVFVKGDFSGQELGIMAAVSGEQLWIDAMLRGDDVHSLTAYMVANAMAPGTWEKAASKGCCFPKKCKCPGHIEMRKPAKINNFMLAYGGGSKKLAYSTGMSKLDARMFVAAHKRVIPNLTTLLENWEVEALDTGVSYSADPYRRRRVLRGEEAWQIENQGKNTPIQSAGANMLKHAMVQIPWEYPIVIVIHDEIVLEVPEKMAIKAARDLKEIMEESATFITGIKGLIKVDPEIQCNLMKDLPKTKNLREVVSGKVAYTL